MTHLATELTVDSAAPVELFTFTIPGTTLAWRYCTDTEPVVFGADTWIPEAISRSDVSRKLDETSSPMTIEVGDENPLALELLAGLTVRPVAVLVQQFHRTDAALERVVIFTGNVAGVSFEGAKAVITCLPRLAIADRRRVPWQTYQATCNWQWGSPQCGVNPETYKLGPYTLSPAAQVSNRLTIPGLHTSGNLSNGWVQRLSDGDTRFIEQNIGGELTLEYPFRNISPAGEQFTVYPGCKRTETDCAGRYNNLPNYLGWSRLPSQNPFERSAFYLSAAAAPTPPVGTTADLGGGYTLNLIPATITVRVEGAYGSLPDTTVTLTAGTDGFLRFIGSPVGANFVNPRPCPASVVSDLDVWFTDPGDPPPPSLVAVSYVRLVPTTGYDAWVPLTSAASASFTLERRVGSGSSGAYMTDRTGGREVHVRIRRRSSGLVLAEGAMTLLVVANLPSNSNGG